MTKRKAPAVTKSGGNVFADLDLPDSQELLAKARLARLIASIIESHGLTQAEAARVLGATQPIVSNLRRGRLSGFSLDRLLRFLNALGRDVEIRVAASSSRRGPARTTVEPV
jgi:predicted XRE-type DNA-binding protein